jgi:hypothetical protein
MFCEACMVCSGWVVDDDEAGKWKLECVVRSETK